MTLIATEEDKERYKKDGNRPTREPMPRFGHRSQEITAYMLQHNIDPRQIILVDDDVDDELGLFAKKLEQIFPAELAKMYVEGHLPMPEEHLQLVSTIPAEDKQLSSFFVKPREGFIWRNAKFSLYDS